MRAALLLILLLLGFNSLKAQPIAVLEGHKGPIIASAFSSDGDLLLTAGQDQKVGIWDARSWRLLQMRTVPHTVRSIIFSPDGSSVALGYSDFSIAVLEARTLNQEHLLKGFEDLIQSLAFSPDGKHLAAGGFWKDPSIRIWSTESWDLVQKLEKHSKGVRSLAFHPDGSQLLSGGYDGKVHVWSTADWSNTHSIALEAACFDLDFSTDGKLLAAATNTDHLDVWNTEDWSLQMHLKATDHATRHFSLFFSEEQLWAAGDNGQLYAWQLKDWASLPSQSVHQEKIFCLELHPHSDNFISAGYDNKIQVWPLKVEQPVENQSSEPKEQRIALLIGNGGYAKQPLSNPEKDATSFAEALRDMNFEVKVLTNLSLVEMKQALNDFGQQLRMAKEEGDRVVSLLYYSGHGMQINNRNYLIPVNNHIAGVEDVQYEGFETERIFSKLDAVESDVNIVMLDACRNNPFEERFGQQFKSLFPDFSKGLAQPSKQPRGTLIAYATSPGSVALNGDEDHSPYMQAVLQIIRKPGLKVEELFKQVRMDVLEETRGAQMPWESSSLIGDFYFLSEE